MADTQEKENEEVPTEQPKPKRRRKGWDQVQSTEVEIEQTGPLITPAALPGLTPEQMQNLAMARKYCSDITAKFQQLKHNEQQVAQMQQLQEAANKQRALLLMSRIYVGSINFELGEEIVRTAFGPFGTLKAVNMSWDSASMKHKGYAFLEYETAEAAQLALEQMNGVVMGGRNIKVGRPNNVPQAAPIIAQIQQEATKYPRIYIASIHLDLTSDDVKSVFGAFGKIKKIELAPDNNPAKHRGWGYIDYDNSKSSTDAIASMNLFDLGGQFLRVGRALTPPLPLYPPNAAPVLPGILGGSVGSAASMSALMGGDFSTIPMSAMIPQLPTDMMAYTDATTTVSMPSTEAKKLQEANDVAMATAAVNPEINTLQSEENVSISGSNARLMIMKKLSRKTDSRVLVLNDMVTVEDLDDDLEEEVTSECSKHGKVDRVIIYQEKQGMEDDAETIVKIFVLFSTSAEAVGASQSLNDRWFGGRMIKAEIYDQEKFEANDLSH